MLPEQAQSERKVLPPRVNFEQLALNALQGGLFIVNGANVQLNRSIPGKYQRVPISLLDAPYGNGPMAIQRFDEDIPEDNMVAVRKNFIEANKLLIPQDQLLLYFHQRFTDGTAFRSGHLAKNVSSFFAPMPDSASQESQLSFQVQSVDRKVYHRNLYTVEETEEALRLAQEQPEVVLAILSYQSIIQDYLGEIGTVFKKLSRKPGSQVTAKDLENYDTYVEQWGSSNFINELLPALAIYRKFKRDAAPEESDVIDEKVFQDAANFMITNGAFRNFVTVPAEIAQDGNERINYFMCPAAGTVRNQLHDGQLLEMIYKQVNQGAQHDELVWQYLDTVQKEATKRIEQERLVPLSYEELQSLAEERRKLQFNFGKDEYVIKVDDTVDEVLIGEFQDGDAVIDPHAGSWLYDVINEAAQTSLAENQGVYFSFNGKGYRISPDKLQALAEMQSSEQR